MTHRIVAEETSLLLEVAALLAESQGTAPPSERKLHDELIQLREELPHAKEEDKGALVEQYNRLVALLDQIRGARGQAEVDPDSPYFAHLRLKEGERVRDLCLGKATRLDSKLRIVDWRNAPISKIFYRYQQGDEYEEVLGDRLVAGEVVARRTVTIRGRDLQRVEAPEGIFMQDPAAEGGWRVEARERPRLAGGEGSALRAHGIGEGSGRRLGTDLAGRRKRSDTRLPDIAGLIDADQFELITRPDAGLVIIRGAAGSGKTTVALHRIAWLAYEDRSVDSEDTLFVVFSQALRDYVAHVLPALGVHRVRILTFRAWAEELRRRHFRNLPKAVREDTPSLVVRLKQHPAMLEALDRQIARSEGPANATQAMDDCASVLTDRELLGEILDEIDPGAFASRDLERATLWCRDRIAEIVAWQQGDREVDAALDEADDALLLRAFQLRVGALRGPKGVPIRYRHVAVDEVQDFSPLEVRLLLDCLDRHQSVTLAGDTQQHVMKEAGFTSWEQFFGHLGVEGLSVSTLRISYRSTREIVRFSLSVLGDLREDEEPPIVTRTGPPVELFRFTDAGACVAFLADALKALVRDEPLASVALLAPDPETSALYFSGLRASEVPKLRRVERQDFTFAPGIELTEIEQVKGLEFDYVVLIEASAAHFPDRPAARRLLHVGASRAVHQLWLTSVATPSPMVREAMGLAG